MRLPSALQIGHKLLPSLVIRVLVPCVTSNVQMSLSGAETVTATRDASGDNLKLL
jgi:hypothetical protein